MLLHFKDGEDDEDCPLPEEVRQDLLEFHQDLLSHCGKRTENPSPRLSLVTFPEVSLRFPDLKYLQFWCNVTFG